MAKTNREILDRFLSEELKENKNLQDFLEKPLPEWITDNLASDKKLRPYQEKAIKTFIWYFENNREKAGHLLFNMATGTGKTLVMATCILYLYSRGYRKFIFFVSSTQIKDQARRGFTDRFFKKFLFSKTIVLSDENGELQNVRIKNVENFSKNLGKNMYQNIEIYFDTIQGLSSKINTERENQIEAKDFEKEKFVFLADEAHHLNAQTKSKTEKEDEKSWEGTIMKIFSKNPENMLLEFTATVEIDDKNIREKYQDKLFYRYDFADFRADGYCKEIGFLHSPVSHALDEDFRDNIEPQKRRMIVGALVLSEYRKIIFEKILKRKVNPLVLFKSPNKEQSRIDLQDVIRVVENFGEKDFEFLKSMMYKHDDYGVIAGMFSFLENANISLSEFSARIRMAFRRENMIIYNSSEKSSATNDKKKKDEEKFVTNSLANLDDENSRIRAVFIVQALKEGWDVLSLYDIVHFDLNSAKKVAPADIQLVGRGARYFPFVLPEEESPKDALQTGLFGMKENNPYKRKYDNPNTTEIHLALLETFYYHFVEEGNFGEKLRKALMLEGIVAEDGQMRELFLKEIFKNSETYKTGFVLVNSPEKRKKEITKMEEEKIFSKILSVREPEIRFELLSDKEKNQDEASLKTAEFFLTEKYGFNRWLVNSALYYYKNKFFHFKNLQKHIVELKSMEDFILNFLSKYRFEYRYKEKPIDADMTKKWATERYNILMYHILPMIEENIDTNIPKMIGGRKFRPRSIDRVFEQKKKIFVGKDNERAMAQKNHENFPIDLVSADWYSHNENYGTTDEKKFVKFFESKIADLREKYKNAEIWLVRNELEFAMYGFETGERFAPDFVLFINDVENKTLYYQWLFEVKWWHLRSKDKWKEDALKQITENFELCFDWVETSSDEYKMYLQQMSSHWYENIKNIGFGFYTANSDDEITDFEYIFQKEFEEKLLSM